MNWFYAIDDQQLGPVSDSQLDELLASGKITRETLVWHEGMAGWEPLNKSRPGGPPPIPGPQMIACAECGRSFPPENMVQLNRAWICVQCKPIFLQKMQEGIGSPRFGVNMWRKNKQLVTVSEAPFPDRCVKCNAPANGYRLKRNLYWHHPAYYLLLFCNLLILVIVVLIVRKKALLHVGLCERHRAARKQAILIGWIGGLGGLILGFGALGLHSSLVAALSVTGFAVFLASAIYAGVRAPMVTAAKITKENVWLNGVDHTFLAELPEWPGN